MGTKPTYNWKAAHCSKMGGDGDWTQGLLLDVIGGLAFWFKDALTVTSFYQTSLDICL